MNYHLNNIQVIGIGQACIDYLGRIPHYPPEDEKIELKDLYMHCGGPASTALVTLSRFGIFTSFIGVISDDPFGLEILKNLRNENIDITFIPIDGSTDKPQKAKVVYDEKRAVFCAKSRVWNIPLYLCNGIEIHENPEL